MASAPLRLGHSWFLTIFVSLLTGTLVLAQSSATPTAEERETRALELMSQLSSSTSGPEASGTWVPAAVTLGKDYLQAGQAGEAYAWLLFAQSSSTPTEETNQLLSEAREQLQRKIGQEALEPNRIGGLLGLESDWMVIAMRMLAYGVIAWGLFRLAWHLAGQLDKKDSLSPVLPVNRGALIAVAVGILLLLASHGIQPRLEAPAITRRATTLKSGPDASYFSLANLSAGVTLEVLDRRGVTSEKASEAWLQVQFSPDDKGWIHESDVLFLSIKDE